MALARIRIAVRRRAARGAAVRYVQKRTSCHPDESPDHPGSMFVFRLWQCGKENHGWREGPPLNAMMEQNENHLAVRSGISNLPTLPVSNACLRAYLLREQDHSRYVPSHCRRHWHIVSSASFA